MEEMEHDKLAGVGEAKDKAEEKLEIARKLKTRGHLLEEIAEDTGLPQEVIERL